MKIFVTGSTGFIGSGLVASLASKGHTIHALYRSESKLPKSVSSLVKFFKGDITDEKSLENAMRECDCLFHTAAFAAVWHRHESEIYRPMLMQH